MIRHPKSIALAALLLACDASVPTKPAGPPASAPSVDEAPSAPAPVPPPACSETRGGAWPRAAPGDPGLVHTVAGAAGLGHLEQRFAGGESAELRFVGAHLFDLLAKL